jgi:hypothetical protein
LPNCLWTAAGFANTIVTRSKGKPYVGEEWRFDWTPGTAAEVLQSNVNASSKSMLFDEQQVAELLRVKSCTVRNERVRGKLAFTRVGKRIFYTQKQVSEYLERQSVQACVDGYQTETQSRDRSETTGSAKSQAGRVERTRGIEHGTTKQPGKRVVSALAQQIFKRRASGSQIGSSRTTRAITPPVLIKS